MLETDATAAREIVREELSGYTALPNYTNNWKRQGFSDDDVDSLSDRLVDALFVWGDVDVVAERVAQHRAAGADHVCLQVVTEDFSMERVMSGETLPLPRETWRELAPVMLG